MGGDYLARIFSQRTSHQTFIFPKIKNLSSTASLVWLYPHGKVCGFALTATNHANPSPCIPGLAGPVPFHFVWGKEGTTPIAWFSPFDNKWLFVGVSDDSGRDVNVAFKNALGMVQSRATCTRTDMYCRCMPAP